MAAALVSAAAFLPARGENAPYSVAIYPDNSFGYFVYRGEEAVLKVNPAVWGPDYKWISPPKSTERAVDGRLAISSPIRFERDDAEPPTLSATASVEGNSVVYRYATKAGRDIDLTMLAMGFSPANEKSITRISVIDESGEEKVVPLPIPRRNPLKGVSAIQFDLEDGGRVVANLEPALEVGLEHNAMRVKLVGERLASGTTNATITLTFPETPALLANDGQITAFIKPLTDSSWFPVEKVDLGTPSVFAMNDWLEKPAGSRGIVEMAGDRFQFKDGSPVKFWGTNLSYNACMPKKKAGEETAERFARYGINAVRLHKFTNHGWEGLGDQNDATAFDESKLDFFDYFTSQLASRGIYYGWSPIFNFRVCPGNRDALLNYDELVKNGKKSAGETYGLINIAEDIQDLLIQKVVKLLNHENPYSGKRYADDPAICFIELQNEDDIFFYTIERILKSYPTYARRFTERYAEWLTQRYGSMDELKRAWPGALKPEESLEAANIALEANPWMFGNQNLAAKKGGARQRLLDNALFFHETQNKFYSRFAKAIRETGYKGPILGSNWQAPPMAPHFYNLLSDYQVGFIDRHNYFGGGAKIFDSMLSQPGSGYLSTGLQQVADRPFGVSEWCHVYPSLYAAEGPAIMAVYGMGLQGWDSSYQFQSSVGADFSSIVGKRPWGVWTVDIPTQLGQYPALGRMIYRGDVKESEVISIRSVSRHDLEKGEFSFVENVKQNGDVKTFDGGVPARALAAGRCVVEFSEESRATTLPPMANYEVGSVITASTRELVWDYTDKGFFTVNTAGTKAVVGFAEGKKQTLGDVEITLKSPYASLFVTALDKDSNLENGRSALITIVARACNTDFQYNSQNNAMIGEDGGTAPILLEPVQAEISFGKRSVAAVNVLDQNGVRKGKTVPVENGLVQIDTGNDKTMYYEVVFQ